MRRAVVTGLLLSLVGLGRAGEAKEEKDVWLGFDAMPDGCPAEMDRALQCKKDLFEEAAGLQRQALEIRKRCYETASCRKMELREEDMEEEFNPNPIAEEISVCVTDVMGKLYSELVGDCLGGPGWRFPLESKEEPSEMELAFDVMYRGQGSRRKRSPEKMRKMMGRMGNGTMEEVEEAMRQLANMSRHRERRRALEESWGTMDHLFDCREPGSREPNYEKRMDVSKCVSDGMKEAGIMGNRTRFAMDAAQCWSRLPRDCLRAYKWRTKNYCYCSYVFQGNPAVDTAIGMCIPSMYHELTYEEIKRNVFKDMQRDMCKKGGKFDIEEHLEKTKELNMELMKAMMEGEVDMGEMMEASMKMSMEMMEDEDYMKMMGEMMEEMMGDPEEMEEQMMRGYRQMEMMEEMEDRMGRKGKGKGKGMMMKPFKKMASKRRGYMGKGMMGKGKGKGMMYGCRPPPPPPCFAGYDDDEEGGYGRRGGYGGDDDEDEEDGYGRRGGYGGDRRGGSGERGGKGGRRGGYDMPRRCRPKGGMYPGEDDEDSPYPDRDPSRGQGHYESGAEDEDEEERGAVQEWECDDGMVYECEVDGDYGGRGKSKGKRKSKSKGKGKMKSKGKDKMKSKGKDKMKSKGKDKMKSKGKDKMKSKGKNKMKSKGKAKSKGGKGRLEFGSGSLDSLPDIRERLKSRRRGRR